MRRGLRLIASGALDDGSIEQLAERLGVGSRHLRRLFAKHLGASPLAVAHTQRLHFAKRLIDQTGLSMHHIATAAGYRSVRRFNDAFKNTYQRSPRELRRRSEKSGDSGGTLTVKLPCRKPFDWSGILDFLDGRATPGVEQVVGSTYFRTVVIDGSPAVIECRPDSAGDNLCLSLHGITTLGLLPVVQQVRELFDVDAPVAEIAMVLGADPLLCDGLRARPGTRVPGAWDGFELTMRAILGQQISVRAATTLAGRIAAQYGQAVDLPDSLAARSEELQLTRLFPAPGRLARARFHGVGVTGSRAETLRRVAALTSRGQLDFNGNQDPDEFRNALTAIPGVGDWTAQYVAMRALKNPDAFPATDLGLVRAIGSSGTKGAAALRKRAESWRPWRAYAAMLLWQSLSISGG